jgi:nucleoside-diphosphate-sugar epimerase
LKKLGGCSFDFVFHLAAQPISGLSNLEPQTTIEVNAGGTKALCTMLSDRCDDATVVLASSACAYGLPTVGASPLTETAPLRPGFYAYTESKQKAEQELRNAQGIRGAIGRFVNVYGPGDRHFSRIVPRTIRQLLGSRGLSLSRGDGSTVLDFLYVDEAVDAFLRLAKYASTQQDSTPQVFNFGIGSDNAMSIRDLVLKISDIYDGNVRDIVPKTPTMEPPTVKFLDSTKARTVLNWKPETFLNAGLRKTIDWYQNHIDDLTHLEDVEYPPATHGELLTEMTWSSPRSDSRPGFEMTQTTS